MARRRASAAGTIVAAVLLLGGCAATQDAVDWVDTVIGGTTPESRKATDVPNQVGKPYRVNGAWYVPRIDRNYDAVGRASWYGRPFHGRRTASGQIFNMYAFTAAHRTLPLGTRVRVTNLANGRSVVVIINDRGLAVSSVAPLGGSPPGPGVAPDRYPRDPARVRDALQRGPCCDDPRRRPVGGGRWKGGHLLGFGCGPADRRVHPVHGILRCRTAAQQQYRGDDRPGG